MPPYELALIIKALDRPATATVLKRTAELMLSKHAVIEKMENLGTRVLPFTIRKNSHKFYTGSYFVFKFHASTDSISELREEMDRDVDVLRPNIMLQEPPFVRPCDKGPCVWGEIKHPMHEKIIGKLKGFRKY